MSKSSFEWQIVLNVKDLRANLKKTQRDIADILQVTPGYIGQIESPRNPSMYSFDQLNRLARQFGCSPKDFMPAEPML